MTGEMRKLRISQADGSAVETLEEVFNLLRSNWFSLLPYYYLGTLPFTLGLVYFINDMACSSSARERILEASLGMAVLFLWMKLLQSLFCLRVLDAMRGDAPDGAPPLRALGRIIMLQGITQAAGIPLRLLSWAFVLPTAFACAFCNSFTVHAGQEGITLADALRKSARQSIWRIYENHCALLAISCFALMTAANAGICILLAPSLLKMFLGVESDFTRAGSVDAYLAMIFNTTFLSVVAAAAYLMTDPLVKAYYAVRVFYADAATTGEDLTSRLARLVRQRQALLLAAATALTAFAAPLSTDAGTGTGTGTENTAAASTDTATLDDTIQRVISRREFAWRLPPTDYQKPRLPGFIEGIGKWCMAAAHALRDFAHDMLTLLKEYFQPEKPAHPIAPLLTGRNMAAAAAVLAALSAAVLLYFHFKGRRKTAELAAIPTVKSPDLSDEKLSAEDFEESEWLRMAVDLIARGDLRLGLRALFLAGLRSLAVTETITLSNHKTNWEYYREAQRRTRRRPELSAAFLANLQMFERVWYGGHNVDVEMIGQFRNNLACMKPEDVTRQ